MRGGKSFSGWYGLWSRGIRPSPQALCKAVTGAFSDGTAVHGFGSATTEFVPVVRGMMRHEDGLGYETATESDATDGHSRAANSRKPIFWKRR